MAERARVRLASPSDSDYANVFNQIFKVPTTDLTIFNPGNTQARLPPNTAATAFNLVGRTYYHASIEKLMVMIHNL